MKGINYTTHKLKLLWREEWQDGNLCWLGDINNCVKFNLVNNDSVTYIRRRAGENVLHKLLWREEWQDGNLCWLGDINNCVKFNLVNNDSVTYIRRRAGENVLHKLLWREEWQDGNLFWLGDINNCVKFNLVNNDSVTYIRRRAGESLLEQCIVPTVKYGGGSVMTWSHVCQGARNYATVQGHLDGQGYIDILGDCLVPTAHMQGHGDIYSSRVTGWQRRTDPAAPKSRYQPDR